MHRSIYLSLCLFSLASSPLIFAEDTTQAEQTEIETESSTTTDTVPLREKNIFQGESPANPAKSRC